MCSPAAITKARIPAKDKWLVQRGRRVRGKANPMAQGLQRWLRRYADLWLADATTALQHGGVKRLQELTRRKRPVSKAITGDDMAGLERELFRLFRKFGLLQIDSAGRSAARATAGEWVMTPQLQAEWNDKLANRVVLLVDETRDQIRGSIKGLVSDALRESPRPSAKELARRIARQWYGPGQRMTSAARRTQAAWPGRGTAEEQRVTADWTRTQRQLREGGQENLFSFTRAQTIARTELAQAENAGIAEGFTQSGIEVVEWLAYPINPGHDGPGKRNHYQMRGKTITVAAMTGSDRSQWFELPSRVRTPYPNWIGLPAGETVNCQCFLVPARRRK